MKITTQLVKHLCEQLGLDKKHLEASTRVDAEVQAFVGSKLASEELPMVKFKELTVDIETKAVSTDLDARFASFENKIADLFSKQLQGLATKPAEAAVETKSGPTAADLAASAAKDASEQSIRVKSAVEMYSHNRTALTYAKSASATNRKLMGDAPVVHPWGGDIEAPSQRDKAVSGAYFKHLMVRDMNANGRRVPSHLQLTDHEKSLVRWSVENSDFIGPIGNRDEDSDKCDYEYKGQKCVSDLHKKALLDDSASGGLEAVPIEFDNMVIMNPLLNGELFPFVDFQNASRRRMEGYKMGEFTFSNTAEGTGITPFTTTSFISAFDTTINTITGACDVGLDFLDDSPANIGNQLTERWGEGFRKEMDRQIAIGSGTGEMTGLTVAAGVTSPAAVASSLPYKVDEVESALFAVPVEYRRQAGQRAVFLSNDTVYKRIRAIPVGTGDARRVYGMNYEEYVTGGHPHKIQAGIASTILGFYCLNWFRGYRRSGYSVNVVGTSDRDNALKNQQTIVVRARYGGQLALAAAGSIIDDLPTS